jgi:predicted nucleotidyltransferase
MIDLQNQNELFMLIANLLSEDIECIAFGGTAMMYLQLKNTTKDIDLLFATEKERNIFEKTLRNIGYKQKNQILQKVYTEQKASNTFAPHMYVRGDAERFDLFVSKIFQTELTHSIQLRAKQLQDFNGNKLLRLKIISPEDLVLLKSVTSRERDIEDIVTIVQQQKDFNWSIVITEAALQKEKWTLLDVEEKMQLLKDKLQIDSKYFKELELALNLRES